MFLRRRPMHCGRSLTYNQYLSYSRDFTFSKFISGIKPYREIWKCDEIGAFSRPLNIQ
jgi:hypothetical protein